MALEDAGQKLGGVVEVDGAYFGGYVKPTNHKAHRRDRRLLANQSGKRQSVVVVRERDGDMLTFVGKHESDGIEAVHAVVETGATIHAEEASHWAVLHARYEAYRINQSEAYLLHGACTTRAASFFSRLRSGEGGDQGSSGRG